MGAATMPSGTIRSAAEILIHASPCETGDLLIERSRWPQFGHRWPVRLALKLEEEQSGLPGCRATDECAHEGRSSRGGRRNWPGTPAFAELRASGCLPVPSSIPLRVAALKVRAPGVPAEVSAQSREEGARNPT